MGRAKNNPVDPLMVDKNRREWLEFFTEPKKVNMYAGALVGLGMAGIQYVMWHLYRDGWKGPGYDSGNVLSDGIKNVMTFNITLDGKVSFTMQERILKVIQSFKLNIKNYENLIADKMRLYENYIKEAEKWIEIANKYIEQYRDGWDKRTEESKKRIEDGYKAYLKEAQRNQNLADACLRSIEPWVKNKAHLEDDLLVYVAYSELLTLSWSAIGLGSSIYIANNPDVVKTVVTSIEKVTVRAIDESSEIIDKTGEAVGDVVKGFIEGVVGAFVPG